MSGSLEPACEGDREGVQGGLPPDDPACLSVAGGVKRSGGQVHPVGHRTAARERAGSLSTHPADTRHPRGYPSRKSQVVLLPADAAAPVRARVPGDSKPNVTESRAGWLCPALESPAGRTGSSCNRRGAASRTPDPRGRRGRRRASRHAPTSGPECGTSQPGARAVTGPHHLGPGRGEPTWSVR